MTHYPLALPAVPRLRPTAAAVLLALAVHHAADSRAADAAPVVLKEMVISAGGFEQEITRAPASITVITREELERKKVSSLAEAIAGVEGVDVDGTDARSNKTGNLTVSIRGLPSEYTLILIDGRRQNAAGTVAPNAFGDSASVFIPPVAAIERIEIIRGPMSTLYGSDAMGGVVNIITRKPGKAWSGAVSLEGTFQEHSDYANSRALNVYAAGPLAQGVLAMSVYGRVMDREEAKVTWPGQSTDPQDMRTMGQNPVKARVETFGTKLVLTPNADHEFTLGVDATRQTYHNDRGQMGNIKPNGDGIPYAAGGYGKRLGFESEQVVLAHSARLGFGLLESSLMRRSMETTGRYIPNAAATPASGRRGAKRTLESTNTVFDTKLVTGIGDHMLTLGGQWWDARLEDGIPNTTFKNRQWGLFVEDEWSLTDKLALTLGLRHDKHDEFGGNTTPRAYLTWQATEAWTLKGGAGKGYRTPWLEQLHGGIIGFGNNGATPLYGNPNLKPERSTNYEVAALFDAGGPLSGHVTLFRSDIKDKIARPTGAANTVTANVGEARVQGIETGLKLRLAQDWTLAANYTYTDSEITNTAIHGTKKGDPLFHTPRHMFNARLSWQATDQLTTWLSGEYRSKRFRDPGFHEPHLGGNAQPVDRSFLGDFKAYGLIHLGGSYRVSKQLSVDATIYNLLDKDFKQYKGPYAYCSNAACSGVGGQTYSNVYNNLLERRRLWVSLNATF